MYSPSSCCHGDCASGGHITAESVYSTPILITSSDLKRVGILHIYLLRSLSKNTEFFKHLKYDAKSNLEVKIS